MCKWINEDIEVREIKTILIRHRSTSNSKLNSISKFSINKAKTNMIKSHTYQLKMLAIFQKAFAHPPEELRSPASDRKAAQMPQETLRTFLASHPNNALSITFADAAVLAYVTPHNHSLLHQNQR